MSLKELSIFVHRRKIHSSLWHHHERIQLQTLHILDTCAHIQDTRIPCTYTLYVIRVCIQYKDPYTAPCRASIMPQPPHMTAGISAEGTSYLWAQLLSKGLDEQRPRVGNRKTCMGKKHSQGMRAWQCISSRSRPQNVQSELGPGNPPPCTHHHHRRAVTPGQLSFTLPCSYPVYLPHLPLASVWEMQSSEILILPQGKHN